MPGNLQGVDVWSLGDGVYLLNDTNVDYTQLAAEAEAARMLAAPRMRMSMMAMNLSSSYAYGNPVYLTNLVVSAGGAAPMTASFGIGGGTNFVPYDIWMTTNLLKQITQTEWTWLGIGYTSYHYTFTNQPRNMAFYTLAKPQKTIVLAWGNDLGKQCDVPWGTTNAVAVSGGLDFSVALKADGTVTAWGNNAYGQTNVPADLTNATVVVAGYAHSLALRADGTLSVWGSWENNGIYSTPTLPAGLTNVVAISAGLDHDIVAKADGTVVVWGYTNEVYNTVPTGLSGVKDVEAGWNHNVALLTNGTVVAWGMSYSSPMGWNVTNVPAGLTNVVAIAAGGYHTLALKANGTVMAWGAGNSIYGFWWADFGQSIVPAGLTNVVAIAAGGYHSLALKSDGTVVVWGDLSLPSYQLNQIIGLAAGGNHALVMRGGPLTPPVFTYQSQPTNIVCIYGNHVAFTATATDPGQTNGFPRSYQWQFNGTNISGATSNAYNFYATDKTTGTYSLIAANAAGSASASWQVTVTNAINVTNDLLLIYNTNSADSTTVLNYYLAHRPNVGGASVLGIGCPTNEIISSVDFSNQVLASYLNWLTNNPAKRPQYLILFLDIPSRVEDVGTTWPSVQYQLATTMSGFKPFVTSINMSGTNDCIGYINKLAAFGTNSSAGNPVISARAGVYGNTNYVLDNIRHGTGYGIFGLTGDANYSPYGNVLSNTTNSLLQSGVPPSGIQYLDGLDVILTNTIPFTYINPPQITNAANVAGYFSWGFHSALGSSYATDGTVKWTGNSSWYLIETVESYNGQRRIYSGNFIQWFSSNAFGGTNYSNTPVGAVSSVDEPYSIGASDPKIYFGLWASGDNFAICAWNSIIVVPGIPTPFQAVGDPFITR